MRRCRISNIAYKKQYEKELIIMDIIDKINATITSTSSMVRQKAGNLAEQAKLNGQISTIENQRQVLLLDLGNACYEKCKQNPMAEFESIVSELQQAETRLANLCEQVQALKENRICPQCGAGLEKDAVFCSSCGAHLTQAVSDATKVCRFCGAAMDSADLFCASCGKKQDG